MSFWVLLAVFLLANQLEASECDIRCTKKMLVEKRSMPYHEYRGRKNCGQHGPVGSKKNSAGQWVQVGSYKCEPLDKEVNKQALQSLDPSQADFLFNSGCSLVALGCFKHGYTKILDATTIYYKQCATLKAQHILKKLNYNYLTCKQQRAYTALLVATKQRHDAAKE